MADPRSAVTALTGAAAPTTGRRLDPHPSRARLIAPLPGDGLNRDQHVAYRAAAWTTAEDSERFLAGVDGVSADDALALLRVLTDKALSADAALHRRRCAVFARLVAEVREKSLFPQYLSALKLPDR